MWFSQSEAELHSDASKHKKSVEYDKEYPKECLVN